MAEESKSLSEIYHEEVEALKTQGVSNAEAIRQVAAAHGKKENAVRGGIHQYKARHADATTSPSTVRRTKRRAGAPTVEDHLANARRSLETALTLIDQEVNDAKAALDVAQSHYDTVSASVKDRKADIEKKLKVLS
jgi:hypothetical protein